MKKLFILILIMVSNNIFSATIDVNEENTESNVKSGDITWRKFIGNYFKGQAKDARASLSNLSVRLTSRRPEVRQMAISTPNLNMESSASSVESTPASESILPASRITDIPDVQSLIETRHDQFQQAPIRTQENRMDPAVSQDENFASPDISGLSSISQVGSITMPMRPQPVETPVSVKSNNEQSSQLAIGSMSMPTQNNNQTQLRRIRTLKSNNRNRLSNKKKILAGAALVTTAVILAMIIKKINEDKSSKNNGKIDNKQMVV